MKKNAVAIIYENELIEKDIFNKDSTNLYDMLEKFQSNQIDGYLINTSYIFSKKKGEIEYSQTKKNNNQFYIEPKNIFELYRISKKINCIAYYLLPNNFKYMPKQFLLKIFNFRRFAISRLGNLSDNFIPKNNKLKNKFLFLINFRVKYYFFRFLQIVGLIKNVDFYFEASQKTINDINKSISKKIENLFPFLNFSFYKKKIRINSVAYDNFLKDKPVLMNKYIVLIDSGFDHGDRIKREGEPNSEDRETYYHHLINILEKISRLYNKEVIICLHPKANYPNTKKFEELENKFKILKGQTTNLIYKAEVLLFFESSAIVTGVMLKKKIINLNSKLMGKYYFKRNNLYKDKINLYQTDLENFNFNEKESLDKLLNDKINNYENYINENIIYKNNISSEDQIKDYLKKILIN